MKDVSPPVGVVAQIMGHAPSALAEKHYRRRQIDMLRVYHEKIELWILREAGIDMPASSKRQPASPHGGQRRSPPSAVTPPRDRPVRNLRIVFSPRGRMPS